MKYLIYFSIILFTIWGCQRKVKNTEVYLYFVSSQIPDVDKYHITLSSDNSTLIDTVVMRGNVFDYLLLKHFKIESGSKHNFTIQINTKTVKFTLDTLHRDTINILPDYNRNKVREMYRGYLDKNANKAKDYFSFIDSLNKHDTKFTTGLYDSLKVKFLSEKPR